MSAGARQVKDEVLVAVAAISALYYLFWSRKCCNLMS